MKRIYLDHAATTGLDAAVLSKMAPYFSDIFGNANSQHSFGREAVRGVDEARDTIASLIGAKPNEIYFTSGGTEADNWAIRGAAHANRARGNHLIVSAVEHPAMLTTAKELEKEGFEVTLAPVDEFGTVDVAKLEESIRPETVFIGVMGRQTTRSVRCSRSQRSPRSRKNIKSCFLPTRCRRRGRSRST